MRKVKIGIKNLSKNFGGKEVLKKLNLNIYESESLAIIGESGSGKSVLTKCINGLESFNSGKSLMEVSEILKNLVHHKKMITWESLEFCFKMQRFLTASQLKTI